MVSTRQFYELRGLIPPVGYSHNVWTVVYHDEDDWEKEEQDDFNNPFQALHVAEKIDSDNLVDAFWSGHK